MNQNVAYLLTAAIVLGLLFLAKPAIVYTPHGIALPMIENTPKASSKQVDVLPPWHATGNQLAWINVEFHQDQQSEEGAKKLADFGRQLARSQGANGLKVNIVGYQPPSAQGEMLAMYILRGVAVHDE